MKRTLSMITLAVLTVGLLGSCSKINERLDNLDKRIDGIENEQIATITGQISGIESSIADLKQIRDDISNLKQTAEAHGEDIFALQEADETLGNRIDNLEDYLENVLPNYAEKEWVKATYSTLEQYDSTCTAIAEINVKIGELDTKIAKDIKTCVDSMKTWVNEKLDAYYTAAEMNAELAKMQSAIDSAKAAGKISDTKADSVASELTKMKTAVDTAKSNIRKEYKAAIKAAIDSTEGRLTKALNDAITTVNGKITNLSVRIDALYDEVNILAGEVTALENMIQSVTIVPAYSDGSVRAEDDTLYLDFIVSPASFVKNLPKDSVTILLNKVQTKAIELIAVHTDSIKVFTNDAKNGTVSIKANIPEIIAELGDESLTVAVNVKKDKSDYTTEFVPVYVIPVGALTGVFSVSATKKVLFSKGNLYAKKDNSGQWNWGFYDKQYEFLAADMEKIGEEEQPQRTVEENETEIHLFTWGYDSEKSVKPTGTEYVEGHTEDGETFDRNEDWGCVFGGESSVWRTLTTEEWQYLFSYDGSELDLPSYDNPVRRGKYKYGVKVIDKPNCVVIAPDNWNINANPLKEAYSAEEWAGAEAAGLVCLPAAGGRLADDETGSSNKVYCVGIAGDYWSSSAYDEDCAYIVGFESGVVNPSHTLSFCSGYSVRLVTDVK